jgi:hypothetical protein
VGVGAAPKPGRDSTSPKKPAYPRESVGLILIAILVLILTIIRYWGQVPWGAR